MAAKRLSQAALARELGISPGRVTQLAQRGMPLFSVDAARAWRAQNVAPMATGKDNAGALPQSDRMHDFGVDDDGEQAPAGYLKSRARREAAEASMAEMRERELAGELIRVTAIESVLAAALAQFREALLQIPNRIGPQLAAESDAGAVINTLEQEISNALHNLAARVDAAPKAGAPA